MPKRVCVSTRDLFFRAKLAAVAQAAGAEIADEDAPCDVAVVELGAADSAARVRTLVGRGIAVLAFGAHVRPEELRAAREAGAVAVPNSQVEERLRELLGRRK
ncbi:MAG: DNA-binding response regulator [Gemmatimonadales bacterium]